MKKFWLIATAMVVTLLITTVLMVYSWTQTPFGTLHYLAAIGLRLVYEPPDIENYLPAELREQYRQEESTCTEYLQYVSSTKDTVILSAERGIPIRLYYPSPTNNLPIIAYYHGGGFVFGTLNE